MTDQNADPVDFILTKEEQEQAIEYAITAVKKHKAWKLANAGLNEESVLFRISQIDWEQEINREEILERANLCKHRDIWDAEQREKDKLKAIEEAAALKKRWTAKAVYGLMASESKTRFGKELLVNQHNRKLITALCFLISGDERYQTELGFSFDKGLLIRGISGIGKTHLVRCIERNGLRPIHTVSMLEVTEEIRRHGIYQFETGDSKIIYLDDVGTEETVVNYFGSKITFLKSFIESLYLRSQNFGHLILSTNYNFKSFEDLYGFRVVSRMRERFNVIDLEGEDLRQIF